MLFAQAYRERSTAAISNLLGLIPRVCTPIATPGRRARSHIDRALGTARAKSSVYRASSQNQMRGHRQPPWPRALAATIPPGWGGWPGTWGVAYIDLPPPGKLSGLRVGHKRLMNGAYEV